MSGHGGLRRRHVPPMLTPEQVRWAAQQRHQRQPYKRICAALGCERTTVRRAIMGKTRSYRGIVPSAPA